MSNHLLLSIFEMMQGGWYESEYTGTCQVRIKGESSVPFSIIASSEGLSFSDKEVATPQAAIAVPPEVLQFILSHPDQLDFRDPQITSGVEVSGDGELLEFIFGLVKRPPAHVAKWKQKIESEFSSRAGAQLDAVPRLSGISEKTIIDMLTQSNPFVITGALKQWELTADSFRKVKQQFGNLVLYGEGTSEQMTLGEFIESMEERSAGQVYSSGVNLPVAMWNQLHFPFFHWQAYTGPQLWMGSASGQQPCTFLHRDCYHNLLAHMLGRKRIVLYGPNQADYLYPIKAFNYFQPCRIKNPEAVDLNQFPLFRHASPLEVILQPGEILVIPAFWFHCVYALDEVLSVGTGLEWDFWEQKVDLYPSRA